MHFVKLFQYESHQFRSLTVGDKPWFVAGDVCRALDLSDVSVACQNLPDDEKGTRKVCTLGGMQKLLCVTESGLYRLIFRSNKPEAEKFRRWVFHEVLPSIRKTGSYTLSDTPADKTVDIRHFRNTPSPSGLDIRYNLDLTRVVLKPRKRSLEILGRVTGIDFTDMMEELSVAEDSSTKNFIQLFVRSCCRPADQQQYVHLAALHAAYMDWFTMADFPVAKMASNKGLSVCLSEMGYAKVKRGGRCRFHGISLVDTEVR